MTTSPPKSAVPLTAVPVVPFDPEKNMFTSGKLPSLTDAGAPPDKNIILALLAIIES